MSKSLHVGFYQTPPLWLNEQFGIQQFEFPEVDLNGFSNQTVSAKLRLGHQMETVFKELIERSTSYEMILHNVPLIREKRTIGEIDFILRNLLQDQIIHVELTYKFYIIDTNISEPIHRLVGPNRRDMFFTKLEKIKNRQFSLLHEKEATDVLEAHQLKLENIEQQCCFKAQLFVPYQNEAVHIRPLNQKCIRGYFIAFDDFNSAYFRKFTYYIPKKREWVLEPHLKVPFEPHYQTLLNINVLMLKESSPMLWLNKGNGIVEKLFVVWW